MDTVFMITAEDRIAPADDVRVPAETAIGTFASEPELVSILEDWPLHRLVGVWNQIPGTRSVSKFENRAIAVARIWRAIHPQSLPGSRPHPVRAQGRRRPVAAPREGSKAARVLALLRQPQGATVDDIMAATEWQAHSVRGFISGNLGAKRGLKVRSRKRDGKRVYSLPA